MSSPTLIERLRGEWYWRVSRRLEADYLRMQIAWLIPRRIALWCFIRVYACTGDEPGPEYVRAYKAWERGAPAPKESPA